ncbi:MAG: PAS domain S-box protein [Ferruginibacter sp.]
MPATKNIPGDISGITIPDKKIRILHLEDLPSDALLIDKALKKGKVDFERLVVDTRDKFIKALDDFGPDIILADHSLPSFNSLDALLLFHETKLQIPFILVTATISEEFAVDIIKQGADDYILKDRLSRLPIAIYSSLEKFRLKKEQQETFEELIKNEKKYHALVENGADGIVILSAEGNAIYVSQSTCRILGFTEQEAMQLNLFALIHPDDREITAERMRTCLNSPAIPLDRIVGRVKHKDGSWIWMEATMTNMLHDPAINGIVENFRDITERKKADEENRFKANLLNTIGQAAIATDLNGVVNYWNKAAENIYGWTQQEAIGKNIMQLTPAHTTMEQALEIMEDLKKGLAWSGEFRLQRKDGTNFPAAVNNTPIYDEHNKLCGIIGISSDITEKKNLEALLDKSSRMARIGSWEYNIITQTHFWSQITREIYEVENDLTPDLQTAIIYYKSGASRSAISDAVDKAIKDGTPWDMELQIVTAKGKELWVRDIGTAEFINGKCVRLYGSFQDINARKKAEIEILKVYEEKNIILESIGDGFFALDKEWVITYWNKQAEILLKRSRTEAIGKNLWELSADARNSISYINYHKAVEEKTVQHYERYNEELNRWLEISAYPSLTGLSVFFKDITDRKISEKQLGELNASLEKHAKDLAISNKELEEFAYAASHDLQEPLRMITGFLGQIEKKYSDIIDDKGKQYIHFAVDGAKRMRQIILDLLEFSRVGRIEDMEDFIDLNDIAGEVILLCQKQIKETKAIVKFENLPSIVTYKTPLRLVFQNLLSNALKYHIKGETPVVNISAEERETHWQFAVSDNGIGIEEEFYDNIFVIFKRLHNKDEYSGTGIGLAVCKRIIENHGGKIWVESEEGKGSTFYFTIKKTIT